MQTRFARTQREHPSRGHADDLQAQDTDTRTGVNTTAGDAQTSKSEFRARADSAREDIDAVIDEIDAILEENAEHLANFTQVAGE